MLWAMSAILAAFWAFGLASGAALGAWLHGWLGLAALSLALALASSRRAMVSSFGPTRRPPPTRG